MFSVLLLILHRRSRPDSNYEDVPLVDGPGVRQVPEGSGEQREMEDTGCEVIYGAPTTVTVKGQVKEEMSERGDI